MPDPDRAVLLLRQLGEPHVRPRVVTASGRAPLDDDALRAELAPLGGAHARCGVAFARTAEDKELLVAVVVEALADLEPLPIRARTGEWLTLTARLHVPASGARLVLLGPRGLPRTAPTSLDPKTRAVRARFALDRPGSFTVQLVADVDGGPRPVLEARVFADTPPDDDPGPAPGEDPSASDGDALERMTASLRASESLPPLVRDRRLDALALAHAERMLAARAIAHDLGEGDLSARLEAAGLSATTIGENVARARTVALAHRALHASPSHRLNLLHARYTHAGFAVVRDDDLVYVCEVFTSGLR